MLHHFISPVPSLCTGEAFLSATSDILTHRGGPKLSVAGACTSVAVDLGDLEGRHPEILERWGDREKRLMELVAWHSFKLSSEQVCSVGTLTASAAPFMWWISQSP